LMPASYPRSFSTRLSECHGCACTEAVCSVIVAGRPHIRYKHCMAAAVDIYIAGLSTSAHDLAVKANATTILGCLPPPTIKWRLGDQITSHHKQDFSLRLFWTHTRDSPNMSNIRNGYSVLLCCIIHPCQSTA
jgi:hypothetical protein